MPAYVFIVGFGCVVTNDQCTEFNEQSEEESLYLDLVDTGKELTRWFYEQGFGADQEYEGKGELMDRIFIYMQDTAMIAYCDTDTYSPKVVGDEGDFNPKTLISKEEEYNSKFAELSKKIGIKLEPKWQSVLMFSR